MNTLHIVALLSDNNYICNCCMGMDLGLPCLQYFQVLSTITTLKLNLGVVHARYVVKHYLNLGKLMCN